VSNLAITIFVNKLDTNTLILRLIGGLLIHPSWAANPPAVQCSNRTRGRCVACPSVVLFK